MRVLVVDDSAFMRKAISGMIESDPDLEVVGKARDGQDAIEKAKQLKPDLITLDIEMPNMNGIDALRRIMRECPTKVLMCSSLTSEGSHETLRAMCIGAVDFIAKDARDVSATITQMRDELVGKIRAILGLPAQGQTGESGRDAGPAGRKKTITELMAQRALDRIPALSPGEFDLVVIGSSTGGPPVLETILTNLPADFSAPIVIAQHMPPMFTKSMTERIDSLSALTMVEVESGMPLCAGTVYVAQGGRHVRALRSSRGRFAIEISDEPKDALYKPSVNELFTSAARAAGSRCLGVMCTGMGDDGLVGSRRLHAAGGRIIAQRESTCVVYGMPRGVVDAQLAIAVLSPDQIALTLSRLAPSFGGMSTSNRLAV